MSADNWAQCPRCLAERRAEVARLEANVQEAYGKVPVAEFDALRARADTLGNAQLEASFREDYEVYGAEDGVVRVDYSGNCQVCSLALKFTHAVPVPVDEAPATSGR